MHNFVRPADTVVWQLAPLASATAAQALENKLAAEPGVAACAVSVRTHCVALVYHPEAASPEVLARAVSRWGGHLVSEPVAPAAPAAVRQCPVPPGTGLLLDKLRFALNLRRFFVSV